jgi:hypothetical protein
MAIAHRSLTGRRRRTRHPTAGRYDANNGNSRAACGNWPVRKRRGLNFAGLDGLCVHELRHSFASNPRELGEDLSRIGKLLSHMQIQTTARQAHLKTDPIRAAANNVSEPIPFALSLPVKKDGKEDDTETQNVAARHSIAAMRSGGSADGTREVRQ